MQIKNDYIKFGVKLAILLCILFVVDRTLGSVLQYYFEHEPLGNDAAFSHAIENPSEDILIYGSSRGVHTYDTRIFSDTLKMSCFNCGRNASTIIYHAAILPAALKNHTPKAIILDLTAKELSWRTGEDGNDILASMILPYVYKNENFEQLAKDLFPKELLKAKISKLYAYNSMVLSIIRNYSKRKNDNIQGYQPLHGVRVDKEPLNIASEAPIDEYAKKQLEFFVKEVTQRKIPLFVIMSPMYVKPFPENESIKVSKQILKKYNVPLWDYSFDERFYKQELFYDYTHLNARGAALFSAEVASRIKKVLASEEK